MKRWLVKLLLASCMWNASAMAADLFPDGKLRDIAVKTKWTPQDMQGGYAMYPGEGKWEFFVGSTGGTTGPDPIVLGRTSWHQYEGNTLFARMDLSVNLNQGANSTSWGGNPCSGNFLVAVNKPRGREDHCMTVEAVSNKVGNDDVTFLTVKVTHTAGGGRYYVLSVKINPSLLGHMNTVPVDWTPGQFELRPDRKLFVERVGTWGERLMDASAKAFAYDKPQDAFNDLPSWRTLMHVPEALAQRKFTQSFLSALSDQEFKKGHKAMAYALAPDGRLRWFRQWNQETQELANTKAIEGCEKDKAPTLPACVLYSDSF